MFSTERTKWLSQIAAASHRSPPSHAAEKIANNDDLLTHVLLNLPIKSLIRFKSVSKRFLSLISDPNFSLLFHRHNPFSDNISGLFLAVRRRSHLIPEFDFVNLDLTLASKPSKAPFKTLAFADDRIGKGIGIVQSCNGLLLCYSKRPLEPRENFVYNPTTKQIVKLPPISKKVLGLSFAFDPRRSPHYTVVCVRSCEVTESRYQIDVYSPAARDWRPSGGSFHVESADIRFDGGVYWNGSIHWINAAEDSPLYFNVDEERISPLPLPPIPEDREFDRSFKYFGESRGHLHLIDHIYDLQAPQFGVYELELDYSRWTVKFRVDLSQVPSAFPQIIRSRTSHHRNLHDYVFSVLCVVRDEIDENSYLVLQVPGKVLRYNLKTKTFFKLRNRTINSDGVHGQSSVALTVQNLVEWPCVFHFIESLALV